MDIRCTDCGKRYRSGGMSTADLAGLHCPSCRASLSRAPLVLSGAYRLQSLASDEAEVADIHHSALLPSRDAFPREEQTETFLVAKPDLPLRAMAEPAA